MEDFGFLLKKRERRLRRDLIRFLDLIALHLQGGYDLGYAWPETVRALSAELEPGIAGLLSPAAHEGIAPLLERLEKGYPVAEHRLWFSVIARLYEEGAGLHEPVTAIAATLRKELERDLERHCRNLPSRTNILLLLFYFPAVALLLFIPLLVELLDAL